MVAIGVALVLVGAALLVAEAHVPAGVLGVLGTLSLAGGAALTVAGAGGALIVALPLALGAALVGCVWLMVAARGALASRRLSTSAGREALSGRLGVVRNWSGGDGTVLVEGAFWRARPSWLDEG